MAHSFEELHLELSTSVKNKAIFNVVFKDLRDTANRLVWKDHDAKYQLGNPELSPHDNYQTIRHSHPKLFAAIYDWPSDLNSINRFSKQLAKAESHEWLQVAQDFVNKWMPIVQLFDEVKPFIVKGRRPSATPRKTPERTLDNTGTCPICGQNVKMEADGRLYHHGFKLAWGNRNGSCFGTGELPVEVSSEGMVNFVNYLTKHINETQSSLDQLLANPTAPLEVMESTRVGIYRMPVKVIYESDNPKFARVYDNAVRERETDIRFTKSTRNDFQKRIDTWEAKPLPGTK